MEQWDRDFIDETVRGYFEFDAHGLSSFQFGYVQGQIDYRIGERKGNPNGWTAAKSLHFTASQL